MQLCGFLRLHMVDCVRLINPQRVATLWLGCGGMQAATVSMERRVLRQREALLNKVRMHTLVGVKGRLANCADACHTHMWGVCDPSTLPLRNLLLSAQQSLYGRGYCWDFELKSWDLVCR